MGSMIHALETECRSTDYTEMFGFDVPLPDDKSVCKTNTSMFLSRSCLEFVVVATAHLFKVIVGNIHLIISINSFLDTQLATEISLGSENTE